MRAIAHDMIVKITGPGWEFSPARILVADDGTAAMFLPPGNAPEKILTDVVLTRTGGSALGPQGGKVTFTRRAAGCWFKLAKCQISTKQLATRWT